MGLLTANRDQNARLDTLESHVRGISEVIAQNQLDITDIHILLIALKAQVDEKVSVDEIDPSMVALQDQLAAAREQYEALANTASENWSKVHAGVSDTVAKLRAKVQEIESGR